jgi:ribosome-binding factor A
MSHRKEQLESSLQRTLGQVIAEGMADPRIQGMISVTGVKVSPDGRHAAVGISVFPQDKEKLTLYGLRSATGHISTIVRERLRIRAVPHFDFQVDPSLKKQAQILGAISNAPKPKELDGTEAPAAEPQEDQPS